MPVKKAMRPKTPGTSKKSTGSTARVKKPTGSARMMGAGTILLVLICIMGAAMIIVARESSQHADMPAGDAPETAAAPAQSKRAASFASPAPAVSTRIPADATAANAAVEKSAPVTIAGCLERAGEKFRLADTDGADAPKSRSWKSGFLKKGASAIDVVDAGNRLKLPTHVGRRVSVTGVLVDRQMQVRSLRRVSGSCN